MKILIVGVITSLLIVAYAASIDQPQRISNDLKNNKTGEQNRESVEPTSDFVNDTDIYRRPGGGGGSSGGGNSGGNSGGGNTGGNGGNNSGGNSGGNAARPPPGGGGPVYRPPRNNSAVVNTNSAILFLPILYFIVAN